MSESNWGGRRAGSGRKKNGAVFINTTISGSPEEIQKLKDKAKQAGLSVSRFVLDRLVGEKDEQN